LSALASQPIEELISLALCAVIVVLVLEGKVLSIPFEITQTLQVLSRVIASEEIFFCKPKSSDFLVNIRPVILRAEGAWTQRITDLDNIVLGS
jgi:hypothetical protein